MRKLIYILTMVLLIGLINACDKHSQTDIVKALGEKVEEIKAFEVDAVMDIKEMNKSHLFDVNIKFQQPHYYKVTLKNRDSQNVQIVLKNDEGVYVLSPALNKSFKFQSDWPLNSSQPYLFQSLVKDIINDKNAMITKQGEDYVIDTKVNYRKSQELSKQRIIVDGKTLFPKEVIVFDSGMNEKMNVKFTNVNLKPKFNEEEFEVEYSMNKAIDTFGATLPTFAERDIMYPTNIQGTELTAETVKELDNGKRAIMTFEGPKSFTVIQEYIDKEEELGPSEILFADPIIICSGVAFLSDRSLIWIENGIEFFLFSNDLTPDQLYTIANSFTKATSAEK
ncbi:MAG: outer membrane lipoprotein carrier protein LolA [Bacilli bacterium]|nr:outer membrane lipoprotein carrier protein LolA [Bacilli bacterium]